MIVVIAFNIFKAQKNINNQFDPFTGNKQDENKEEQIVEVSFNEEAVTDKYIIKCDGAREYKYDWYEKESDRPSGIIYYGFHLVFNNKSNDMIGLYNKVNLTYTDDKGNEDINAKKHFPNTYESSELIDNMATANNNYSGYVFFELPSYVKDVKIKYNNVIIKLENFKDLK